MVRHTYINAFDDQSDVQWSPELMLSMKGTFERQYARDKLIDILYSEQRRVRRAVPGPADGYYHPNEINGVRLPRKGRGVPPSSQSTELLDSKDVMPRRGKGLPQVDPNPLQASPDGSYYRRLLSSSAQVPACQGEQQWPHKGRRIVPGPAEAKEQLWPCKGKKMVQGRNGSSHDVSALIAWNPDAELPSPPPAQTMQHKFGKRVTPDALRSRIVFG